MITYAQITEMRAAFHDAANAFQRLAMLGANGNAQDRDDAFRMHHAAADRFRVACGDLPGWDANGREAP